MFLLRRTPRAVLSAQRLGSHYDWSHPSRCLEQVLLDSRTSSSASSRTYYSGLPPYHHEPLPHNHCVRYIVLHPGRGNEPLSCNLEVAQLDQLPTYDAVSYPWGNPKHVSYVKIGSQQIGITANLHQVLRRVRKPQTETLIWADQICIDQSNLIERASQVGLLMADIFRRADRVLIWLGGENKPASKLASFLQQMDSRIRGELAIHGTWSKMLASWAGDDIVHDSRWSLLNEVCQSSWFERAWVIQEVGMAKEAWALYGDIEFDWLSFMRVSSWRANHLPESPSGGLMPQTIHVATLHGWGNDKVTTPTTEESGPFGTLGDWSFVRLLVHMQRLEATDPRDRVYSLLGHPSAVMPSSGLTIVQADYQRDCTAVYWDVAATCLQENQDLSVLYAVEHGDGTIPITFPSWVPDWRTRNPTKKFSLQGNIRPVTRSVSTGLSAPSLSIMNRTHLHLRGLTFDVIQHTSRRLGYPDIYLENVAAVPSAITEFWHYLKRKQVNHPRYSKDLRTPLFSLVFTLVAGTYDSSSKQYLANLFTYTARLCELAGDPDWRRALRMIEEQLNGSGSVRAFADNVRFFSYRRVLVHTTEGRYGLAPFGTQNGDVCALVAGSPYPFILRPTGTTGVFKLVGGCYIEGTMNGEVVEEKRTAAQGLEGEDGKSWIEDIVLI